MSVLRSITILALLLVVVSASHLRYAYINAGTNGVSTCSAHWESIGTPRPKLCKEGLIQKLNSYINSWKPDIVLLTEVYQDGQMKQEGVSNGPILPLGYDYKCRSSTTKAGLPSGAETDDASHEHLCIAYKRERVQLVGDIHDVLPSTSSQLDCPFDFGAISIDTIIDEVDIRFTVVHSSFDESCQAEEDSRIFNQINLVPGQDEDGVPANSIFAGTFNREIVDDKVAPGFEMHYQRGKHFNGQYYDNEFTHRPYWTNPLGSFTGYHTDSAGGNFGSACPNCGETFYGTLNLKEGAALGGFHGHPRWDGESGLDGGGDHRQIMVDLQFESPLDDQVDAEPSLFDPRNQSFVFIVTTIGAGCVLLVGGGVFAYKKYDRVYGGDVDKRTTYEKPYSFGSPSGSAIEDPYDAYNRETAAFPVSPTTQSTMAASSAGTGPSLYSGATSGRTANSNGSKRRRGAGGNGSQGSKRSGRSGRSGSGSRNRSNGSKRSAGGSRRDRSAGSSRGRGSSGSRRRKA